MRSEDDRRIDLEQVRVHSAEAGISALKDQCQTMHGEAARLGDTEAARGIRREADDRDESAEDLRGALQRGLWGLPRMRSAPAIHQQGSHGNPSGAIATISDRAGLAVGVVGIVLSALALGQIMRMEEVIDAKVQAGVAQANATATTANQHARIALDKVEDFRAKLAEKGVNVTLDGH